MHLASSIAEDYGRDVISRRGHRTASTGFTIFVRCHRTEAASIVVPATNNGAGVDKYWRREPIYAFIPRQQSVILACKLSISSRRLLRIIGIMYDHFAGMRLK